jgi:serine/threonine-protein kinase HipA
MPDRTLVAYLDGARVGQFTQSQQGNTTFAYDDTYRAAPAATPLSLSMPLAAASHRSRAAVPFLEGLIPDSPERLKHLAAEFHTTASPFAVLSVVGRDAAGAVQLLPSGEESDDAATRQGRVRRHSPEELDAIVGDIVANATTWGRRQGEGRWSLPGAQPKIALFRFDDGGFGTPEDSTPTNYILKPAIAPYDQHDVNEYVTMEAARLLGLEVADHEIIVTEGGHRVFASRRYDRAQRDGGWHRLHQEDLCQAMAVSPARKYQSDGGPSIARIARLFRDRIADVGQRQATQRRFFEAIVFNAAAACTDAHAKNFSLLLDGSSVALAPLYDLGTHAPYPLREAKSFQSAMSVGGTYLVDQIGANELLTEARRIGVDTEWAAQCIDEIRGGLAAAFAEAAAQLDEPFAAEVAQSIARISDARGWSS